MWEMLKMILPLGLMTFAEGGDAGAGGSTGAEGGTADAGSGNDASGGVGQGSPAVDWRTTLPPDIKDHSALKDFKSEQDVVKAYVSAQPLIGVDKIPVPQNFDNPEVRAKFANTVYDRLGRPKEAKDYKLSEVKMPNNYNLPPETREALKTEAHKLGLLPHQLDGLYQWYMKDTATKLQQQGEQNTKSRNEAENALRQEFGQAYDAKVTKAQQLLNKFAGDDYKALLDDGFGNRPEVVRFMAKMADVMSEDGYTGGTAEATMTPEEAQKELAVTRKKLMSMDKGDPEYKAVEKRRRELMEMSYPDSVPIAE